HETDVVAVAGVLRAGIAEADEEQHGAALSKMRTPGTAAPEGAALLLFALGRRGGGSGCCARGGRGTGSGAGGGAWRCTGRGAFGAGHGARFGGGSGRSGGSGGGLGGGPHFFGVARRRHHGDQRHV